MFLDKDLMEVKLEVAGTTYYFSNTGYLYEALLQGGSGLMRMCNYAISGGLFLKNRTCGVDLPNTILSVGRDDVNKLFDFMENK
ncbi:hypothetical protein [Pseudomonas phage COT4]|uniref:Uncharacterized protein n=1 Tax=Pseudomonas phage M5.1 TaxID=2873460 RepID=A0AAE8XE59_9CAUD|nr:hypothetical protein QGX13_gp080 [Pseudomonas phage M5.1]UAV89743.1 hypothetical protein M51_162 [Pseudomonas phage M5.1]UAV90013.1 hypothetical protein REC_164 [Pseudomonas phage REC]UGL61343.1 hypothetical protein [Pseudomonas phage COT4]UGL62568.1 hypothetical protein [Pseudomonas phage REC1]